MQNMINGIKELKKGIPVVRSIWHVDEQLGDEVAVWVLLKHDATGKVISVPTLRGRIDRIAEHALEAQKDGASVWFSVNGFIPPKPDEARKGRGRTLDRVAYVFGFYVDYDFPEPVKTFLMGLDPPDGRPLTWSEVAPLLRNPPSEAGDIPILGRDYPTPEQLLVRIEKLGLPQPTYMWFTGGGYDLVWVLKHPLKISSPSHLTLVANIQQRLVQLVGGDEHATDLARVIRWPCSVNYKYARGAGILGTLLGGTQQPVDFLPIEVARRHPERAYIARTGIDEYLSLWTVGARNAIIMSVTAFLALLGYSEKEIIAALEPRIEEIDKGNPEHSGKLGELRANAHYAVEKVRKDPLSVSIFAENPNIEWSQDFQRKILDLLDKARGPFAFRAQQSRPFAKVLLELKEKVKSSRKVERVRSKKRKRRDVENLPLGDDDEELVDRPYDWLVLYLGERKDGEKYVKEVHIHHPTLAEEVIRESKAYVGAKDGTIVLAFVWDEHNKRYVMDVGALVSKVYDKLREAEEYIYVTYGQEKSLATPSHVNQVKSYIAAKRIESKYKQLSMSPEEVLELFDDYSRYIPVRNGVLDMETGELLEKSPEFRFTFELPVEWDPDADVEEAERYLAEITHPADLENLKRFLGYLLVPGQPLKKYMILVGPPDSGKTTLLFSLLREQVLGREQVSTVPLTTLTTQRFAPIRLLGKLANFASESPDLKKGPDVERLKQITGGDAILVEEKNKPSFSAKINAKLIFAVNKIPKLSRDPAVWSRTLIVRFPNRFPRDPHFAERLKKLAPAMLKAMVQWRKKVLAKGFVEKDLRETRVNALLYSDPVAAFALDALEEDPGNNIPLVDVYRAFCRWAARRGIQHDNARGRIVLSPEFLERILKERGSEGIKYKLRSFAKALRQALEEEGYFDSVYKDTMTHTAYLYGFRIKEPATEVAKQWDALKKKLSEERKKYEEAIQIVKQLEKDVDIWDKGDFEEVAREHGIPQQRIEELWQALVDSGDLIEVHKGMYRLKGSVSAKDNSTREVSE